VKGCHTDGDLSFLFSISIESSILPPIGRSKRKYIL
jgi:hypothetical protein